MKIYTLIYTKWINKKDLLNRTGDSTEQTVITYMREKKNRERIDTHLCITESSSCTPKTNITLEINSTPI